MTKTLAHSEEAAIGLKRVYSGKVRDIYAVGEERFLMVATDRISAFDAILSPAVPEKGKLLTQLSAFWFKKLAAVVSHHMISADYAEIMRALPQTVRLDPAVYDGRLMLVKKAKRLDAECVVRGYLAGSGWKDYLKTGAVCGHPLPKGLSQAEKLSNPIFTPATKADTGHDENISREALAGLVGADTALQLEKLSLKIYAEAAKHMESRGLILADTKFEFGIIDGEIALIDEALTPDSSRFWEKSKYSVGSSPESFDKQFVRDYLERSNWDKNPPAPVLPANVIAGTTARYREAFERISQ